LSVAALSASTYAGRDRPAVVARRLRIWNVKIMTRLQSGELAAPATSRPEPRDQPDDDHQNDCEHQPEDVMETSRIADLAR
jgi:hypothetical protein